MVGAIAHDFIKSVLFNVWIVCAMLVVGGFVLLLVDRLSLRGFVTASNDPNDKRRRAVVLTEEGRRVTEAAITVAMQITADTLLSLTEEERRTIARLLKKLA